LACYCMPSIARSQKCVCVCDVGWGRWGRWQEQQQQRPSASQDHTHSHKASRLPVCLVLCVLCVWCAHPIRFTKHTSRSRSVIYHCLWLLSATCRAARWWSKGVDAPRHPKAASPSFLLPSIIWVWVTEAPFPNYSVSWRAPLGISSSDQWRDPKEEIGHTRTHAASQPTRARRKADG
jgi:hypothetical protein